jgi:hypothetical protein
VQNESLHEFSLVAATPVPFVLQHQSKRGARFYSDDLNTFTVSPIGSAALNAIFDAQDAGKLKLFLSAKIWFLQFLDEVLKQLTRLDDDTFNLARPKDPAVIDASYKYERKGKRAVINHFDAKREIKDIPCKLSGWDITPSPAKGKPPSVKLFVHLRLKEDLKAAERDEAVRIFIAADYSKIYRFGLTKRPKPWWADPKKTPTGLERNLQVWEMNVMNYLLNHTSLARGEKILQEVIALGEAAISKPQLEVVKVLRDAIDARLITANHWGDLREDWKTEQYQRKLSDVFGAIQQTQWSASPVRFLRFLARLLKFTPKERASMILQFGTGHCGEHALTSFLVVQALMEAGHTDKFEKAILSGNSNIDHAFVVGGILVEDVIRTKRTKAVGDSQAGATIVLFDLREALKKNPGKKGFVLDPYLAPTVQAKTCTDLLVSLNAERRGKKKTDLVQFDTQHPVDPVPAVDDRPSVKGI